MNLLIIVFLTLFIFSVHTVTIPCIIWRNSFIKVESIINQTVYVRVRTLQTKGWFSVGFSSNESLKDSIFIFFNLPNQFFYFKNHTEITTSQNEFFYTKTIQNWADVLDGVSSFGFTVNMSTINKKFVYFANHELLSKDNQTLKHQHFTSRPFFFDLSEDKDYPLCEDRMNKTGRLMASNFGLFFIANAVYVFLLFNYVYFRNDQPLKSRFIAPFTGVLCIQLNLLSDTFGGYFDYESYHKYLCISAGFFSYPMVQAFGIITATIMIRYQVFLQIHLRRKYFLKKHSFKRVKSTMKASSGSDSEVDTKVSKFNEILGNIRHIFIIFQSPWTLPIIVGAWVVVFMIGQIIIFAISGFQCKSWTQEYMVYWHVFGEISASLITAFAYIFDIFFSLKHCVRCRWKVYFLEEDPYLFRVDFLVVYTFIPIFLFYAVISSPHLFLQLLSDSLFTMGLIMNGGSALMFTLISKFLFLIKTKRIGRRRNKINLNIIMKDEILLQKFIEFSESEWAVENVYFMVDALEYRKKKDIRQRKTAALEIKERYLIAKVSPLEINITGKTMNLTFKKMDDLEFSLDLFEKIEREVEGNICDTISRFIVSNEYGEFLEFSKENEENLSKLGNNS
jgi:hypothetical protein